MKNCPRPAAATHFILSAKICSWKWKHHISQLGATNPLRSFNINRLASAGETINQTRTFHPHANTLRENSLAHFAQNLPSRIPSSPTTTAHRWRTQNVLSRKVHFTPLETLETLHKRLKVPKIKILGVSSSSGSFFFSAPDFEMVLPRYYLSPKNSSKKRDFTGKSENINKNGDHIERKFVNGEKFPLHYHANRFSFH